MRDQETERAFDPVDFWNRKILSWERGRYGGEDGRGGGLKKLADMGSSSLRYRMAIAREILEPHVTDKRVVEVGCGSGLLAPHIISCGAESYSGFDFSHSAIDNAIRLADGDGIADKANFEVADVSELPVLEADIVISLGVLDWLDERRIDAMFEASDDAHFLHTIAERRTSLHQLLHRAYVYVSYGRRSNGYVPQYHSVGMIEKTAARYCQRPVNVYRHRRLSFGAILTTLPLPVR